jgi:succinate dehydrogenase/fumarate reductase flavoprotein subunit
MQNGQFLIVNTTKITATSDNKARRIVMDHYETLKTEVLIIGGGAAGLRAAIEARTLGADVCILSKGPLARSGITPLAYASFQAAFGTNDARDNPDIHYQDIIEEGRSLSDQCLARVLADESIPRARDLEKFGVKFKKQNGKFFQVHHPGQTYPRCIFIKGMGFGLVTGLKNEIYRHSNIKILEDFCVSHLLVNQGEVVGGFGLNMRDGKFYCVQGKSTVLACGGYEELWGATDTAPDSTGDGVFLGFQAGADLIDLEMALYYPAVFAYPESVKGVLIEYETFLDKQYLDFRLLNNAEKEFLPEGPLPARDTLVKLMIKEIQEGRGTDHNALYVDPGRSSKSREELNRIIKELLKGPDRNLKKLGINIREDRIEIYPAVHYTLGGIWINQKTETSVQGLFAAGENSSNVHGANRISGNALAETQVFGARAGKYAYEYARNKRYCKIPSKDVKLKIEDWNQFMMKKKNSISPLVLRKEMKKIMDRYLGTNRTEKGMNKALRKISDLKQNELPKVEVVGGKIFNIDWRTAIEVSMALNLAELLIRSALQRKETRGHHFRSDFPETLEIPEHTRIRMKNQNLKVDIVAVRKLNS